MRDKYKLHPTSGHTCDDVEWFMLAKYGGLTQKHYRHELSIDVIEALSTARDALENEELSADQVSAIISRPIAEVREELFYCFVSDESLPVCTWAAFWGNTADTFDTFAVVRNGETVSRAWSVRLNDQAAEIAVETKEGHRRKGYGKQVVCAWIRHQLTLGKVPFYAHRKYNLQSKALAESLGAFMFADVTSYQ